MKRVEAKKIAKQTIVKLMATLYTGKYGNPKLFEMWCKTYAAGGAEMHLKHYSYTLWVNIYQNGEVSYVLHTNGERGQRVIILPEAEVYDDEEVNRALTEFCDFAKSEMKEVFRQY
jgi:hypothetical protein